MVVELRETRSLQKTYESKCNSLMDQLTLLTHEFQEIKRQMVGSNELSREREERIDKLRSDLFAIKEQFDRLEIEHGTLKITHAKMLELYESCKTNLDDTTNKLHITNKARHTTEVKLGEELEKNKNLNEILRMKEEILQKRQTEIEELDKRVIELERNIEALEIKRQSLERSSEITKKQMQEKI